jgi:hypothetical protein
MFASESAFNAVTSTQDGDWGSDDVRWNFVDGIQIHSGYGDDEFDMLYEDVEEHWVSIVADLESIPEEFDEYAVDVSNVPNEVIIAHDIA